jgi:hypothetical protein
VELVRVNDKRRLIDIAESKETIKHAPHFGQDETVSAEREDRVRTYFRMEPLHSSLAQEGSYPSDIQDVGPNERVDVEPGERAQAQEERLLRVPLEGESLPGGRQKESRPRTSPPNRRTAGIGRRQPAVLRYTGRGGR